MKSKGLFMVFVAALVVLMAFSAVAADYPSRDIKMVCPWGAGGGTDAINRQISKNAEKLLPVSIYVQNVDGGMSGLGVMEVMKARPDGYTLGTLTYDSVITVPRQKLVPGYSMDRLKLIARITQEADALMVAKGSSYKTFDELIAAAKENPGTIKVGMQENGSRTHLAMLRLQDITGAEFHLISYSGGAGPQKEAILNGEVDVVITSLGDFAPLINSGDVVPVVTMNDKRNPRYTDVPTAIEKGIDLVMGSFVVIAAPADTPDDIVAKLEDTFKKAYNSDEFQSWLKQVGVVASWLGTDEVTEWAQNMQDEYFEILDKLEEQGVI